MKNIERLNKVTELDKFYQDRDKAPIVSCYEEGRNDSYFMVKNIQGYSGNYGYFEYEYSIIAMICSRSGEYKNQVCREFSFNKVDEIINKHYREMQRELNKRKTLTANA